MKTLFDENFKPLSFFEMNPDESLNQFIFDSSINPNRATCLGIAKGLRIKGATAMNIKSLVEVIGAKLNSLKLLEQNEMSKNEKVIAIVKSAQEDKKVDFNPDLVIVAIVQSGVGFRDALSEYEKAMIELGYMVRPLKPTERNNAVAEILIAENFEETCNAEDFAPVQAIIDLAAKSEKLKGEPAVKVLKSIRIFAKEHELAMPKKPSGASERSNQVTNGINFMLQNHALDTTEKRAKAIGEYCKDHEIGVNRSRLFGIIFETICTYDPETTVVFDAQGEKVSEPVKSTMKKAKNKKAA